MMNVVMKSECCPLDWKRSLLVPFHKDGDVEQVGNYRWLIRLYCSEGVCKIIGEAVGKFAKDRILTEAQGGFRSGRCSDQWLVLRGI